MKRRRRRTSRNNNVLQVVLAITMFVALFYIFFNEIIGLWNFAKTIFLFLVKGEALAGAISKEFLSAVFILISFVLLYLFFIFIYSQFLLPTENWIGRKNAYRFLRKFMKGSLGTVIRSVDYINPEAKILKKSIKPAIALVDLSSALVVEKNKSDVSSSKSRFLAIPERKSTYRVYLPGVNFLEPDEVLQEFVDLRTQVRNAYGVVADTWEKIKLETDLFVVFSVGQPPEELLLTIIDNENSKLGIIILSDLNNLPGSPTRHRIVADILSGDVLDLFDYQEAYQELSKWRSSLRILDKPIVEAIRKDRHKSPPFHYDPLRIQSASVLEVASKGSDRLVNWRELPLQIALDRFRTRLAITKYDDLYLTYSSSVNALMEFRKCFSRDVQNQGILGYRFVQKMNNEPFRIGDIWDETEIHMSDLNFFSYPKILRSHGIRVIEAGFSDLRPDEVVRNELVGYWKARQKKESDLRKAKSGIELNELRMKARNDVMTNIPGSPQFTIDWENREEVVTDLIKYLDESIKFINNNKHLKASNQLTRDNQNKLWELQTLLISIRDKTGAESNPEATQNSKPSDAHDE
jgi:hypothetical protein